MSFLIDTFRVLCFSLATLTRRLPSRSSVTFFGLPPISVVIYLYALIILISARLAHVTDMMIKYFL